MLPCHLRFGGTENMEENKPAKLLQLFFSMLYISAFTFGGGFVIVSLMKKKFVDELGWIDEKEMLDMAALAQASPGAIAVNASILVGRKVGGRAGAAVAVMGTIIPPMVIIIAISFCYKAFSANPYVAATLKGMQAGVAAVIFDVVCDLGGKIVAEHDALNILLMGAAFAASCIFKINVASIILVAICIGILSQLILRHGGKRKSA